MEATPDVGLFETSLHSLPLIARGKVRDNYAVGTDRILMVASDRLSAFDVVMNEPIPGKGKVLTEMALFWFDRLKHIVPNHLTGDDPESVVAEDEREQVRGRSMLVRRLRPLPVEAVVRGYLAGSAWKEYQATGAVCGVPLPPGLKNASKLPAPIFTPATKAERGSHDENIDFTRMSDMVGAGVATQVRDTALRLYIEAAEFALTKGIIIADTKFEFGMDEKGVVTLMDEVLTPDSSRFWPAESYLEGLSPPSLDKQVLRDWLEHVSPTRPPWNKREPAPILPPGITQRVSFNYREALDRLRLARKTQSRLAKTILARISSARNEGERKSRLAELCMYHSRSGNVSDSATILKQLFETQNVGFEDTVWRNLAEGLYDHYTGAGLIAIDKLKRAHALCSAGGEDKLRALSAVWLAHLSREKENLETIKTYVDEALRSSAVDDHSIRSRANLVVGDMFLSAGREDLAAPWHGRASRHALIEGDDATISALAFNTALMRVSRYRHNVLRHSASLLDASAASTYTETSQSIERLLGTNAMADLGKLQYAQVLSLHGDARHALPLLEAFAHYATVPSANRMRAEWSSDIAWCYARVGSFATASEWVHQSLAELSPEVHLDDLAAIHSRLALVYSVLGEKSKEAFHFDVAAAKWNEYEALQRRLVDVFQSVQCYE